MTLFLLVQTFAQKINLTPDVGITGDLKDLTVNQLITSAISLILVVAAVVFFFILVIGGIKWITSAGDKAKIESARGHLTAALVGIVIVFSVWAIIKVLETFFGVNILTDIVPPSGGPCFVAGTKIKMADGTYKEIQDIKEGDFVYSYNLESKSLVQSQVKKLITHKNDAGGYLIINETLKVTPNHLLWVENRLSWNKAETLATGDILLNPWGEKIKIEKMEKVEATSTVYNLYLEGDEKNYFAEEILVHNAKTPF